MLASSTAPTFLPQQAKPQGTRKSMRVHNSRIGLSSRVVHMPSQFGQADPLSSNATFSAPPASEAICILTQSTVITRNINHAETRQDSAWRSTSPTAGTCAFPVAEAPTAQAKSLKCHRKETTSFKCCTNILLEISSSFCPYPSTSDPQPASMTPVPSRQ